MAAGGRFITLDGVDGGGKSTQLKLLAAWLTDRGHTVVTCRDPGSTALGDALRATLLGGQIAPLGATAEMFLYMAARAQLVEQIIRPALAAGQTVLSDRFLLANVVYQGYGRGLDVAALWQIGQVATGGVEPDLTLVLDVPPEVARARMSRPLDRLEQEGEAFRARLRQGYLSEAARPELRITVIDASGTVETVQAALRAAVLGAGLAS